jgi:hypothetical protein
MLPSVWLKKSQIEAPRPSARTDPSIEYAAVVAPSTNSGGNSLRTISSFYKSTFAVITQVY